MQNQEMNKNNTDLLTFILNLYFILSVAIPSVRLESLLSINNYIINNIVNFSIMVILIYLNYIFLSKSKIYKKGLFNKGYAKWAAYSAIFLVLFQFISLVRFFI